MARPKQHEEPAMLSFQVDGETWKYMKQVMVEDEMFNKSKLAREIFEMGLEVYKEKRNQK